MKFPERWLRTYVDPPLDSDELAHLLTMAGLEVEAVEPVAPPFTGVVVAEVKSVTKHPAADRLNVCQVDVGGGEVLQIVCGAPNVAPGMRVPCARIGAVLPGMTIGKATVRGVESFGMLCSARELGLAEESPGLLTLGPDAPLGVDLRLHLDLDDRIFTLKLTPNRSDCLSVAGIARDVAAMTGAPLQLPDLPRVPSRHDERLVVSLAAPEACPRYCGRVIRGVDGRARTPEWMVRRLVRCGLRPISPLVDITNYVLLERGQPMHAFDRNKLVGDIAVRMAEAGERLALLDGQTVDLEADMLVIADAARPVALAGIMGGAETAVDETTRDVFLEAAFFAPAAVAGRGRRLGLATDSSYRFERGVDFGATRDCLEYATRLVVEICGGEPGPVTEVQGPLPERPPIRLRPSRVRRLSGLDLDDGQIVELLRRLRLAVRDVPGAAHLEVTPPTYRFDLSIEEDLVEEIVRLHGYENLPARLPRATVAMLPVPETRRPERPLRERLVDRDYHEVVTYSFVDAQWEADLGLEPAVVLRNPIASQMAVMRTTLWGGLLDCLRFNLNRRQPRVRLFELGRTFHRMGDGFYQPLRLGGLAFGQADPEQWGVAARTVDFFDVKGDVESLFGAGELTFRRATHPALHPGRSAEVLHEGRAVGWVGHLHPRWVQKYELPGAPVLFELALDPLLEQPLPRYREVSKFPPVRRDLAVIIDEKIEAGAVLHACREAAPAQVTEIEVFDVYQGKGIDSGKKSLALRILMQDTRKTLTDPEVDAVVARLTQVLSERFGARLRH